MPRISNLFHIARSILIRVSFFGRMCTILGATLRALQFLAVGVIRGPHLPFLVLVNTTMLFQTIAFPARSTPV
jgi:hypothetical protein